jgi:hypothetical protein
MSALPRFSDIDLFGYRKRIVHLDPLDNGPYSRSLCGLGGVGLREDSPFFCR